MPGTAPGLFTIGHSNVALDDFLGLLQQHAIHSVADVRTVPRSRYVPHFNAGQLRDALARCEISYVPFGRELGGRPEGISHDVEISGWEVALGRRPRRRSGKG